MLNKLVEGRGTAHKIRLWCIKKTNEAIIMVFELKDLFTRGVGLTEMLNLMNNDSNDSAIRSEIPTILGN